MWDVCHNLRAVYGFVPAESLNISRSAAKTSLKNVSQEPISAVVHRAAQQCLRGPAFNGALVRTFGQGAIGLSSLGPIIPPAPGGGSCQANLGRSVTQRYNSVHKKT